MWVKVSSSFFMRFLNNLTRQLRCQGFESEILRIHLEKLRSKLLSAGQNVTHQSVSISGGGEEDMAVTETGGD